MPCPTKRRLKRHLPLLQVLKNAPPALRKAIIKTADDGFMQTLSECSLNVLHGNQAISPKCKATLRKYRAELRLLASPRREVSTVRKRRILSQRGGFLSVLLGSLLSGVLSKLVS